jgi:hypothetical protein
VNRARGTLLDYYDVALTEGPWCDEAYASAAKQARRFLPKLLDYTMMAPPPLSRGPSPQQAPAGPSGPSDNRPSDNIPLSPPSSGEPAEVIPPPVPLAPQAAPFPSGSGQP